MSSFFTFLNENELLSIFYTVSFISFFLFSSIYTNVVLIEFIIGEIITSGSMNFDSDDQ